MQTNEMARRRVQLLATVATALVGLTHGGVASAQGAPGQTAETASEAKAAEAEPGSDIVVTASRVNRAGFDAPTPTTVIGDAELRQASRPNIAAVLNDLPAFRATLNPGNTGLSTIQSGVQSADLRGLGSSRTLVLLNGHRFVGDNDLNTIPIDLVERVEVVTGGASAGWGSGAVAGVVNVILDDKITGLRLSARSGISSRGDGFEYRVSAAGGLAYAGGRGHLTLDGEYYDNRGISTRTSRKNIGGYAVLANPAFTPTNGQNAFLIAPNVGPTNLSFGGLITTGVLAGQTFNPDGTLRPFSFGTLRGATLSSGGEQPTGDAFQYLTAPVKRYNLFGRTTFDVSDGFSLFADMRYMRSYNDYPFFPDQSQGNITIRIENAFLPEAVRARLQAAGQTSFNLGRLNNDFAFRQYKYSREDIQGVVGAKGSFGDSWNWDVYYTHGQRTIQQEVFNARIVANFNRAVDAVVSPTTGQPVCRITLTDSTTGCVPVNLFGFGRPSAAAADYINGEAFLRHRQKLDTGAATLRGEPFSTWAGPVSLAVGGELRRESIKTLGNDPISLANGFTTVNSKGFDGRFSVKEAFGEVVVPLVRNVPLLRQLEFNGAARVSDYSNSGTIWAWKIGLTNRVTDDLRLRFVRSRDTRSASLIELFTKGTSSTAVINDPVTRTQYLVTTLGGGNAALAPEEADTTTYGAVYSPSWLPGFNLSVDRYDIDIDGAIVTISGQDIVTRCAGGNLALCPLITRTNGLITSIQSTFINLSNYRTKGIDFEASYILPMSRISASAEGSLRLRALATYVETLETFDGVRRTESRGVVGTGVTFGVPEWRGVASVTYQRGASSVDLRARYIGPATFNPLIDIANNSVESQTYFDLSFEIGVPGEVDNAFTLFGSVSNMFDKAPPLAANPQFYDVVGRYLTVGARVRF